MKNIYYLYLCSFPFVHAFAISGTINFSVILSVILFLFLLYENRLLLNLQIWILIIFLLNLYFSLLINFSSGNFKLLSHSAAWTTSIVLFYISTGSLFKKVEVFRVKQVLYWIFYITIIFSLFEFIDVNILHSGVIDLIPRPFGDDYDPTFIFGIRSRSFFVESGYFAMFVALYFPVICYFERGKLWSVKNVILIICTIISMILAFSTTFFILSIFFALYLLIFKNKTSAFITIFTIIIVLVFLYTIYRQEIDDLFSIIIFSKFESGSFSSRTSLNEESINYVLNSNSLFHILFGYGPGSYDYLHIEAAISTYVNLFRDLGIVGLTIFIFFYCSIILKLFKSKTVFSKYLMISLLSTMVYLHTNTSYYYAFCWFIVVLSVNDKKIENYES